MSMTPPVDPSDTIARLEAAVDRAWAWLEAWRAAGASADASYGRNRDALSLARLRSAYRHRNDAIFRLRDAVNAWQRAKRRET